MPDALRQRFDLWWSHYPRHVAKQQAWRKWQQLKPDAALLEQMVDALNWQKTTPQWREAHGQFVPYPSTWLHQWRWQDEAPKPTAVHTWSCPHTPSCDSRWKCEAVTAINASRRARGVPLLVEEKA